jgi:hypothetical protein
MKSNGLTITIDGFLLLLQEHASNYEWHLVSKIFSKDPFIRTSDGLCPLSAVWKSISGDYKEGYLAAFELGLSVSEAGAIVRAADYSDLSDKDKQIRKQMLEIIFGIDVKD